MNDGNSWSHNSVSDPTRDRPIFPPIPALAILHSKGTAGVTCGSISTSNTRQAIAKAIGSVESPAHSPSVQSNRLIREDVVSSASNDQASDRIHPADRVLERYTATVNQLTAALQGCMDLSRCLL